MRIATDGTATPFLGGLTYPQGITSVGECLFVIDVGTRKLIQAPLAGGRSRVVAAGLPVGVEGGA